MLSTTAIEACWLTIEPLADLESIISLSSTCRSLRDLLFDATTNKVKVTHFKVCNLPPPVDIDIPRNSITAPLRIPHYTSQALNHIHFSSLLRLHLDFPLSKKRHAATGDDRLDFIEDVHTSSFPTFVFQLGVSENKLVSLHLNCSRLMQFEKYLEFAYEVFGQNLSRCCPKLEELSVVNTGRVIGGNDPVYSAGLAMSLVPTLKKRKNTLRMFQYESLGEPLPLDRPISSLRTFLSGVTPNNFASDSNRELFNNVLRCTNLECLHLKCSSSSYRDFALGAAEAMSECQTENQTTRRKPSSIRNLKIISYDGGIERNLPSASSILEYFSGCHSLYTLQLRLPRVCWYESQTLEALKKLLIGKRELQRVDICFSKFDFGKLCEFLLEIITDSVNENSSCYFYFSGFGGSGSDTHKSNRVFERFRTNIRGTIGVRGYGIDVQGATFTIWIRI